MKKFFSGILLFMAVFTVLLCSCSAYEENFSSQDFVFDTYSQLTISGKDAENVLKSISADFENMSDAFALCYNTDASALPENDIYKNCCEQAFKLAGQYGKGVNVTCGVLTELWGISTPDPKVPADDEISSALNTIINEYNGDFSKGTRLDFGAVAKGYACDSAYKTLHKAKTDYAVISLGSTTLMYGEKKNNEKFRTGITDPSDGDGLLGIIETEAAFISTSGGYERYFESNGERYCHILNIETGRPIETDLTSVTVIVPAETVEGGIMSDFLSTLIFTEGTENIGKWLAYDEFEVVAADKSGAVYTNCSGFELEKNNDFYLWKEN